jgi:hypothetical protein
LKINQETFVSSDSIPATKGRATMTEPERALSVEEQADKAARELGREILGRDLTADEAQAMCEIFRASVQALKQGFIRRLANHVRAERETESVEEFFGNLKPD